MYKYIRWAMCRNIMILGNKKAVSLGGTALTMGIAWRRITVTQTAAAAVFQTADKNAYINVTG